jgi:prevent-host-death family protein
MRYAFGMQQATLDEAERGLGELIARVRAGESIEITDGGETVARLVPAEEEGAAQRIARLERAGILSRPEKPPLRPDELPEPVPLTGVLDALLDERGGRIHEPGDGSKALIELEQEGLIAPPTAGRVRIPNPAILETYPESHGPANLLKALLEEREENR